MIPCSSQLQYNTATTPRTVFSQIRTPPTPRTTKLILIIVMCFIFDSSVGIATRYGLGGPGIGSRWGARLSAPVQTGHGAHPASYTMGTGSFTGVKDVGRGTDQPPPSIIYNIIFINCKWVGTRWQWLFYVYTECDIDYY
jgi:hypothetical protein